MWVCKPEISFIHHISYLYKVHNSTDYHIFIDIHTTAIFRTFLFLFQPRCLFFFNLNLFILIRGQLFYNIVLVLPYINVNLPRVYTCSPSWTPLPPASAYHPSGSSQCTSPKLPVFCIEPGLAIRFLYDIIHVSMPFSQIIPQLPLPQSPKDCSKHLCFFCCLTYRVIVLIFMF